LKCTWVKGGKGRIERKGNREKQDLFQFGFMGSMRRKREEHTTGNLGG